jgi:hypothetical protein
MRSATVRPSSAEETHAAAVAYELAAVARLLRLNGAELGRSLDRDSAHWPDYKRTAREAQAAAAVDVADALAHLAHRLSS